MRGAAALGRTLVKEKFRKSDLISGVDAGPLISGTNWAMICWGMRRSIMKPVIRKKGTMMLKAQLAGMMPRRESSPTAPRVTMKPMSCPLSAPHFSKIATL